VYVRVCMYDGFCTSSVLDLFADTERVRQV